MTKGEIIAITNQFLIDEFEVSPDVLTPEANLKDSLDLDSLDYVDLVVVIESNFGIKLGSKDFSDIATCNDLYNLISGKLHAGV